MDIQFIILYATVFGSGILCTFGLSYLINRAVNAKIKRIYSQLQQYFEPYGEENISEFGRLVDAIGKSVATNILATIKAAGMGEASGEAKREKLVEEAIATDQLQATNPLLAMAAQSIPSLRKLFKKNPATLLTAANMFKGGEGLLKSKSSNGGIKNLSKIGG